MKRLPSLFILIVFCFSTLCSYPTFALTAPAELVLPPTGKLLPLSSARPYTVLRGMRINPNDPMKFEFVIDKPKDKAVDKEEFRRLVSYFMAALTIPEQDFWVNLSPYEQDRVIPDAVAGTDFGRDLLAQDYVLKQVAASITYPETALGKAYWDKVYSEAAKAGLSRNQAINAFSKVWIVPENVEIFEDGTLALVGNAKLKVLSESDYTAMNSSSQIATPREASARNDAADKILKEMVIPALTKEVNTGSNFTQLRQMFHSFALALWFKNKLKDSFFKYYINQNKTKGIDLSDKTIKDKIYNQYVAAFKTGVYNMIKKESVGANNHSPAQKITKRQYFSGGIQAVGEPGTPGTMGTPGYNLESARDEQGGFTPRVLSSLVFATLGGEVPAEHAQSIRDFFAQSDDPMIRDNAKVLTPAVFAEMYRVHILSDEIKDKETFAPLIEMIEREGVSKRVATHIVQKLASKKVHLLGRKFILAVGLTAGLVALNCGGSEPMPKGNIGNPGIAGSVGTGGVGGSSDVAVSAGGASGIDAGTGAIATGGSTTVDAEVASTDGTASSGETSVDSSAVSSQDGQADTANPVGGTPSTGGVTGKGGTNGTGGVTGTGGTPSAGGATGAGGATAVSSTPGTMPLDYDTETQQGFAIKNSGSAYVNSDPQNPNSISISASLNSSNDWGNAFIEFSSPKDLSGYTLKVTVVSTNGMQGLNVYDIASGVDPSSISTHRNALTITGFKAGAAYAIPLTNSQNTWRIVFEAGQYYGTGNPVGSSSAVLTLELVPNNAGTNGSGMTTIDTTAERAMIESVLKKMEPEWRKKFTREVSKLQLRRVEFVREDGTIAVEYVYVLPVTDMPKDGRAYRFEDKTVNNAVVVVPTREQVESDIKEAGVNVLADNVIDARVTAETAEVYFEHLTKSEEKAHTLGWHSMTMAIWRERKELGSEHELQLAQLNKDPERKARILAEKRGKQEALIKSIFQESVDVGGKEQKITLHEAIEVLDALDQTYGGVDMAKTKITQHVLGAQVKLNVSAKVVAELKNAKSVGFEILSLGDKFVLR